MNEILLLHGPNLNALGRRDPGIYPRITLAELEQQVTAWAAERGWRLRAFQSNCEGALIDELQRAVAWAVGALVNLGALTHTSYALHDALLDFQRPVIEVHLSRISQREPWRRVSVIRPVCRGYVEGRGVDGYRRALEMLAVAVNEESEAGR
ncbi:MAG: type II 3-dehydroquinate dehydratase [Acidobacteriota bacterium]|nr:type II 3-dehydroquinate dehydratase [Acidobacteriota bacterium]MDQ7087979.1 type II 3-dehydroquinate dehydratase [Acidobacteriota bacterium]